jgi:DNA polymerase elongation subunit (family B)
MNYYTNVLAWGNKVFVRGVENSQKFQEEIKDFKPPIWVPAKSPASPSKFHTLSGYPVIQFEAGSIKETRDFIQENKDVDNFAIYGDIQAQYQWITQNYKKEIQWNLSDINIVYVDIETTCDKGFPDIQTAEETVIAIAIRSSRKKHKKVFGLGPYNKDLEGGIYVECETEEELLEGFLKEWKSEYPDIITGWNVSFFDIPYLVNRMCKLFGEIKTSFLSPWKILKPRQVESMGTTKTTYDIFGVAVLDWLDLYKKFTYTNQESYKLDHIAFVELGTRKLDYSQYGSLHTLYKNNFELFIEYNAKDIDLVIALEEKMKLIELAITMAYDAKVNFDDVFSQVRMWDVIIYNHLLSKGIVIPGRKEADKRPIEGAFVKEPNVGFYNWVVSYDLTSLYPMLIQQYNISPETLLDDFTYVKVDDLVEKKIELKLPEDVTMAANGHMFTRKKRGFLPELMAWMFAQRKEYKGLQLKTEKELEEKKANLSPEEIKEYTNKISKYKNLQMAKKICLNSAYGAAGNEWFRFFDVRLAEAITKSGQLSIRWIERKLNEHFNRILKTDRDYIIAVDTDSVYINFDPIVNLFLKDRTHDEKIRLIDKICNEQIGPYIDKSYDELAAYMSAYENKMSMKRESIADRGIWTAKKRYILHVHDSEGVRYAEPKLKVMGIEAVRSSTPGSCRSKIKEALKIIMTKEEKDLIDFVAKFKEEFSKMSPDQIAFPRSINGLPKYKDRSNIYKKGSPIQVRGSLLYNYYLNKLNLHNSYREIYEGEKVKFLYLKEPNVIHDDVISFPSELPKEFNLHDSIDYAKQFQKTFIEPLSLILEVINWNWEKKVSLDSLFE